MLDISADLGRTLVGLWEMRPGGSNSLAALRDSCDRGDTVELAPVVGGWACGGSHGVRQHMHGDHPTDRHIPAWRVIAEQGQHIREPRPPPIVADHRHRRRSHGLVYLPWADVGGSSHAASA